MKIILVTGEPFPRGFAATNRIISYGKGFIENGLVTKVICLRANQYASDWDGEAERNGLYAGIPYEYSPGSSRRVNSFVRRRWLEVWGLINGARLVAREHRAGNIDALLMHTNSAVYIVVFGLLARLLGIKYLQEKSELPFVLRKTSIPGKIYSWLYVNCIYKFFDGILVETERLGRYFSARIRKDAKLLTVPATVDSGEILEAEAATGGRGYIFYCGTLSREKKDGLHILIKAFGQVHAKFPELELRITGNGPEPELEYYRALIGESGLGGSVHLLGAVPREELVRLMKGARLLALAKERDEMQSGGLSSKVVEYLYTGNPVVLTDLGEITGHLEDGVTVYFAKPDDVGSLARTMIRVLSNYDESRRVGLNGKEFALRYFDYRRHTARIAEFVQGL